MSACDSCDLSGIHQPGTFHSFSLAVCVLVEPVIEESAAEECAAEESDAEESDAEHVLRLANL